ALKFLPEEMSRDPHAVERFEREARAASALNHPNICTIHEIDAHHGKPFIVMELLDGQPLADRLQGRPVDTKKLLEWGLQVAEALDAAHGKGIVHRDIKPANIFLSGRGQIKVLDFGLAKLLHPASEAELTASLTQTKAVVGTLPYMAPEQLRAEEVDARTDVYALGAVLYEMATGRRPFDAATSATLAADILRKAPPPPGRTNPELPARLDEIILKCLEKDPENRYQTARELAVDLQRLKRDSDAGLKPGATQAGAATSAPRAALNRRGLTIAAATLVVVALAASGAWWLNGHKAHALTAKDTIVLADFTNTTGDAVFDGTLRQGLSVQLEQSPFLSIVSDQQVQQTMQMMNKAPDVKLTPQITREICQRTASAAVLEGSIAQIGTQYLLTLKAVNCATGESLASTEAQASDKNHVLEALGKVCVGLRNKLGESLSTVQKFATPLEQATTPSLEALKAFSSGIQVISTAGSDAAIPFCKHAIELDPTFALPTPTWAL